MSKAIGDMYRYIFKTTQSIQETTIEEYHLSIGYETMNSVAQTQQIDIIFGYFEGKLHLKGLKEFKDKYLEVFEVILKFVEEQIKQVENVINKLKEMHLEINEELMLVDHYKELLNCLTTFEGNEKVLNDIKEVNLTESYSRLNQRKYEVMKSKEQQAWKKRLEQLNYPKEYCDVFTKFCYDFCNELIYRELSDTFETIPNDQFMDLIISLAKKFIKSFQDNITIQHISSGNFTEDELSTFLSFLQQFINDDISTPL